ncbi:MAG TPA: HlyD family secretion protein [Acetobacteraceae bacterium]|nr:HlyD family secretion protein [Acetobacteraceae bacterium]
MNAITGRTAPDLLDPRQSRPTRAVRSPRRLIAFAAGALGLTGAALFGNWYAVEGRYIESTDDAYVHGDIAVLSARVPGEVAAIPVADNEAVRAGTPLIVLDTTDWQARLDQARAQAAQADAALLTAGRQSVQQQSTIRAAEAAVAQASAQQEMAAADAARASSLVGSGFASHQANEHADADRRKADAAMTSAQAQLASARDQLSILAAQAQSAQAAKQNAEAAVRLAQNDLDNTVIRAPFDGIAGNRAAQLGQHVERGAQLVAVTPAADKLYVTANFKETELRGMSPGQPARVVADIAADAPVQGRVESLAPATGALFSLLPPENATGNFTRVVQRVPVRIALDPDQAARAGWLRAGLSVTASVDTRGPAAQRRGVLGAAANTLGRALP